MPSGLIAVTGGTGFVGGALIDALRADGWRLRVLVRNPGRARLPGDVEMIQGDLGSEAALAALCDGADCVIHGAALTRARSRREFFEVNAKGAGRIAAALSKGGAKGAYFVLVSSLAAREPKLSAYAASKRGGEKAVANALSGRSWTALRPPAVYGPGDMELLSYFRAIRRGIALAPAIAPVDGRAARLSMIHVRDLAAAIAAAARQKPDGQHVLEVSDGTPGGYEWRDVRAAAAAELGVRPVPIAAPFVAMWLAGALNAAVSAIFGRRPMLTPGKVRELFHHDWSARCDEFAALTDWRPQIALPAGFRETIDWYRGRELL
ncbi:MAG: NAD-dependent epimerase/dehydratase family protein [Pseudomonadota bacterium]